MALVNTEISRNDRENTLSVLRRFRRRVQGFGALKKVRSLRYFSRSKSPLVRRQGALKRLEKKAENEHLYKLGKIDDPNPRRRKR